jgi:hypothetical protein
MINLPAEICNSLCDVLILIIFGMLSACAFKRIIKSKDNDCISSGLYSSCPEYKRYTCTSKLGDPYDDSTWTQLKLDFDQNVSYYHNPSPIYESEYKQCFL